MSSPTAYPLILAVGLAFALVAPRSAHAVLEILVSETGNITLSADGAGSSFDVTIQVDKPNASATVRSAYLSCASLSSRVINDGDVSLNGNPIDFSASVTGSAGANFPIFFNNVFGEVTAIVKPVVDAAPPGLVDFTQSEVNSNSIDGCALYVIFDDPSAADSTILVLFGAQSTTGDSFNVTLAEPLDPATDTADFGLAISFSSQGSTMVSLIDVNGKRLTSSAGGQDDGIGALITVGGIGDTNDNPPPDAAPTGPRFDDELYSLLPFLGPMDTSIKIDTINPTDDDNIFAGHMVFSGLAVEGEGILLVPSDATNFVGDSDTLTATVVDNSGVPVAGRLVNFRVDSGPNAGEISDPGQGECAPNDDCTTDATGRVVWTYTSNGIAGTDRITATFTTGQGLQLTSNLATRTWISNTGATLLVDPIEGNENPIVEINNALLAPSGGISIVAETEVFVGRVGDGVDRNTAQSATYINFNVVSGLKVPAPSLVLPNGILLTSGNANILNANTSEDFQGVTDTGSDAEAAAILADAGQQSILADVNSYSFEFTVPDGIDAVSANFVFGSEEFPTTPFSDFFLFIVDGVNYARFEDEGLVVFQDGVNEANFNDNDFNNPEPNYPIEYDGLSNVLLAIGRLDPKRSTHSLKIIVGDTSNSEVADPNLDSAVFIGGLRACEFGVNCESGPPLIDSRDPQCVSLAIDGSQAIGFATDDAPSEDTNGNGFLDPGEDANGNGLIDFDSGIDTVALDPGSSNLTVGPLIQPPEKLLQTLPPGADSIDFSVTLIDITLPGTGTVSVTDGFGNTCSYDPIVLPAICVPDVACDTGLNGVCADGLTSCDELGQSTCVAQTQPGELLEVCDSADNDCDGAVDEGLDVMTSCGADRCVASGVIACVDGTVQPDTCQPVEGVVEQTTCGADRCAASGVIACVEGTEQPDTCQPFEGVVEQTACGVGQCAAMGVVACEAGEEQMDTCMAGDPGPEICDGVDNNCNESIDECCPGSDLGTEGCPVCSDLLLVEGSETQYMGTATDTAGISLITAPFESNLTVMPDFVPGDMVADFTVGADDSNSPAGGIVAAVDTDGLVCFFDPIDVPIARSRGTTPTWSEGVRLVGDFAYVLDETAGLSIFAVANLESSGHQLLGTLQVTAAECPNGVFYDDLEVRGTTVVIAGGICGLIIVDVSDPAEPFVIATFDTMGEVEDAVFGSDSQIFVADFFRGLVVVDVSIPGKPTEIAVVESFDGSSPALSALQGEQSLPLLGSPIALVVDEARNLLYLATTRGLFIIDIDPETPGFPVIGSFDANPDDGASQQVRNARTPQDVVIAGDVAYLSVAQAGLMTIDVSNPSNPQPVGDSIPTVQIFYKLSVSETRLFVAEGSCGVAVFQIVGPELREVLGSPFPIAGSAIDCSNPRVSDTFAWSIDELAGRVIVGTGILSPGSGGFEFVDFTESLAMLPVPEPDHQWMFAVAIASVAALRRRRSAAAHAERG